MDKLITTQSFDLKKFLMDFRLDNQSSLYNSNVVKKTELAFVEIAGQTYPKYRNEFWTSKQRQASSLHEIAYRACFKGQLPRFFIELLTKPGDVVYDPFSGRGTTVLEAALLGRNIVANDINPISKILYSPRLNIPSLADLQDRLKDLPYEEQARTDLDLSMFYHPGTEAEVISLKNYLKEKQTNDREDALDAWIRMVATNRLTGHSPGFFPFILCRQTRLLCRGASKR